MNIAKNMEVIFLTAAVLLGASAYATAAAEASAALQPALQAAARFGSRGEPNGLPPRVSLVDHFE